MGNNLQVLCRHQALSFPEILFHKPNFSHRGEIKKPLQAETKGNYTSIKSCLWLDASISSTKLNDVINLFKDVRLLPKMLLNIFHSMSTKYSYKFSWVVILQVACSQWVMPPLLNSVFPSWQMGCEGYTIL